MTNEPASIDMKDVWQRQTTESAQMSSVELRRRSQKLSRKVFWRNLREYVAAAIVVAGAGYHFWIFPTPLERLGSSLMIASVFYVVYQLHARGSARVMPPGMALHSCLEFHRKELERQRDLLRSLWSWCVLPIVPGVIVFRLGIAVAEAATSPGHVWQAVLEFSVTVALVFTLFFTGWKLNRWASGRLQLKIDALIALEKESK
jgi:hypothetical protein